MGTSGSYTAPTSGNWPAAKGTATRFARQGGTVPGPVTPAQVTGAYLRAHGGAAAAAASAVAGHATAQRLGGFLSAVAGQGLGSALAGVGLATLVGHDTVDVLTALVERLAGASRTLEEMDARAAVAVVLQETFGVVESFADLEALCTRTLDAAGIQQVLAQFLTEYIYIRLIEEIGDRFEKGALTCADARRAERDIHAYIVAEVHLEFALADPLTLNWDGPEAAQLVGRLLAAAYQQLE